MIYEYYKLVSTRDDGSYYIGVLRRLRRACMYAWPRQGFRFSHKQSMQVKKTPNNFKTSSRSGHARMSVNKRLFRGLQ